MALRRSSLRGLIGISLVMSVMTTSPADGSGRPGVLFLGITQGSGGQPNEDLTEWVDAALLGQGTEVIRPEQLTPAERRCRVVNCLAALARTHERGLVLTGWIEAAAGNSRTLVLLGYDAAMGRALDKSLGISDSVTGRPAVATLVGQVLSDLRESFPSFAPSREPAPAPPVVVERRRPEWRRLVATCLGTLAVVTLAGSITLAALHHRPTDLPCRNSMDEGAKDCRWNLLSLFGPGFAASGVLLVGTGLSLGLPPGR